MNNYFTKQHACNDKTLLNEVLQILHTMNVRSGANYYCLKTLPFGNNYWMSEITCQGEYLSVREFCKVMREVGVNNFNLDLNNLEVDFPESVYKEVVYN